MRVFRFHWIFCLVLALPGIPAIAQETGLLTMSGTGRVAVAPDMATVSIGVEVVAPTADRALRLNSAKMAEIIEALQGFGLESGDIQTSEISLAPRFETRDRNSNEVQVVGFGVTNTVTASVRQLDRLGAVLDAVVKTGANRIYAVRFGVSDPSSYLDEARRLAVADARHKAEVYAGAAGIGLGPLVSLAEHQGQVGPVMMERAAVAAAGVPVAEGQVDITATVTLQFAIE